MSPRPSQQTFVYGTFLWPRKGFGSTLPERIVSKGEPDIALEILREFSASEFVGKLYTKPFAGSWEVVQFDRIRSTAWYEGFEKMGQHFVFIMQGSGPWEVLHFRPESDETGPYVAVALREFPKDKAPAWVASLRKRFAI